MKIKDLFNVILKIIGIILLKDAIITLVAILPLSLSSFERSSENANFNDNFESILLAILYFISYFFIAYIFIFKANWVIKKLKLTQDFSDQNIAVNISAKTVISIALFILGGWLIVNEVPNICRQLYYIILEVKHQNFQFPFDKSVIIVSIIKIILGLLLVGEQRRIVAFLDKRAKLED